MRNGITYETGGTAGKMENDEFQKESVGNNTVSLNIEVEVTQEQEDLIRGK